MPLRPGERFDRYDIVAALGRGGMGEVYSAYDTRLHRRVALKVLRVPPGAPESNAAARLLREARAAAGLGHPNAVAIYDVGEVDGVPFLAMEIVNGRTLRAWVGDPSASIGRRVRWLIDVAHALAAAHEQGIVHRDVKPENVMIRDDDFVKVLDFGIARRATSAEIDPTASTAGLSTTGAFTRDSAVVGTPNYMAPEQMRGEPLDGRTDQFAWGVVAYELLTGALPWDTRGDAVKLVAQVLSREPIPPSQRNPEIPAALDDVIRTAMAKAQADRFASMDDIADAMESFAAPTKGRASKRPPAQGSSRPAPQPSPLASTRETPNENSTRGDLSAPAPIAKLGPPRVRWRAIAAPLAALALAGLAAWGVARVRASRKPPPAAAAPSSRASAPSPNSEATSAFVSGVRALRDASTETAETNLDRAIRLDPSYAAAHLMRALLEAASSMNGSVLQEHLRAARAGRDALGDADRALLEGLEPWATMPPDLNESRRRLEASSRAFPTSAELAYALGVVLNALDDDDAIPAARETLARDPTFAMAWEVVAYAHEGWNDVDGAVQAEMECLKLSPGADTCLWSLARIQRGRDQCRELATTSRRILALIPESSTAYSYLAGALAATGEPLEAVRSAFEQKWERTRGDARRAVQLEDEAALALLAGDFSRADQAYADLERARAAAPNEYSHFEPAFGRMSVAEETGREDVVKRLVAAYASRRSAWNSPPLAMDPSISVYSKELAVGGITRPAFDELRDAWRAREAKRRGEVGLIGAVDFMWTLGWSDAAMTKEDALAALALRDGGRPFFNVTSTSPDYDASIGHTYLLARQIDDALFFLDRASGACSLTDPLQTIPAIRATLDRGEALETRDDKAGACDAYGRVLARWGASKPASRTATKARARATALGCKDVP